ncbi:MAG: isochorismatase family protein [Gallionella sp.]|nr:isochorismatase family protein [Gallionella sp.]MDD4959364.1 isochorismatase family protein [Gallionella sp.]
MKTKKIHLLIIDPQNDFCDLPDNYLPKGIAPSLPVAGAHDDMLRVAEIIRLGGAGLSDISVTLDTHQLVDIAHPTFWQQGDGTAVQPFTQIQAADVQAGRYLPRKSEFVARTSGYLKALEDKGGYVHMVWPVHCQIGTWGNNVHDDVRSAYNQWEVKHTRFVNKIVKGTNPWTEHYSAIQAEVPDSEDKATWANEALLALLKQSDTVLIAGEAGSHCVKATTEHIAQHFGAEADKLVLLTDCMSAVAGFETQFRNFIDDMTARGVKLMQSAEAVQMLVANTEN